MFLTFYIDNLIIQLYNKNMGNLDELTRFNLENFNQKVLDLTGGIYEYENEMDYALNYIKNAHYLIARYLKYDNLSANKVKAIADKEKQEEEYNRLFNLKRLINTGFGVCRHAASLLIMLVANENSGISLNGIDVKCSLIHNCKIVMPDGKVDPHTLCMFEIYGKKYFCDPTMANHYPNQNFCLLTKNELQGAFYACEKSKIAGASHVITINTGSMEELFDLLNNFKFVVNRPNEKYEIGSTNF